MTAVHTGPWKNLSLHSFDQCPWCHAVLAAHSPASVCSESEPRTKNFEQRQQKTRGSEKIVKVRLPSLSACAYGPVASHKTSKNGAKNAEFGAVLIVFSHSLTTNDQFKKTTKQRMMNDCCFTSQKKLSSAFPASPPETNLAFCEPGYTPRKLTRTLRGDHLKRKFHGTQPSIFRFRVY